MDKNIPSEPIHMFEWKGLDADGKPVSGFIEANHYLLAKNKLEAQGIKVLKLFPQKTTQARQSNKKITPLDITLFIRQLALLTHTGIALCPAIEMIREGQTNRRFTILLETMQTSIQRGLNLSEVMRAQPQYFNPLLCHFIETGEQAGTLQSVLTQLADYREKLAALQRQVIKALTYPAFVLHIALLITISLLVFVVPQFQSLFDGFNAPLPPLTRCIIHLAHFFESQGLLLLCVFITVGLGLWYGKKQSIPLARFLEQILFSLPLLRTLLHKSSIAQFCRTFSMTYTAGLPLIHALDLIAKTMPYWVYFDACEQITNHVSGGESLQQAIQGTGIFPNRVIQMIQIGEESGNLDQILQHLANLYEREVAETVDSLCRLLEPIIMVILGLFIGGVVIGMYLPLFKLGALI